MDGQERDLEVFLASKRCLACIVEWIAGLFMKKKNSREELVWMEGYRSWISSGHAEFEMSGLFRDVE